MQSLTKAPFLHLYLCGIAWFVACEKAMTPKLAAEFTVVNSELSYSIFLVLALD